MKRTVHLVIVVAVLALAGTALAQFGGVKVPKMPAKGNQEDVTTFVKAADGTYSDVKVISVDVPGQMIEVSDEVMGLKDFPADDAARAKYTELKTALTDATAAVGTTNIGDMKSLKEANKRVDDASDALVGFMKDMTSKEGAMQALGGADLTALKKKAQGFLDKDTKAVESVTGKIGESGKSAPPAVKAWTLGIPDSYTVQLTDGTAVGKKQLESLVKDGPSHLDAWKSIMTRRITSFKDLGAKLGLL